MKPNYENPVLKSQFDFFGGLERLEWSFRGGS